MYDYNKAAHLWLNEQYTHLPSQNIHTIMINNVYNKSIYLDAMTPQQPPVEVSTGRLQQGQTNLCESFFFNVRRRNITTIMHIMTDTPISASTEAGKKKGLRARGRGSAFISPTVAHS